MKIGEIADVKGGKRLPKDCSLLSTPTKHPYIKIKDMYQNSELEITSEFEYIDEETFDRIKRYTVEYEDVIIAIVGNTIGLVSIIGRSLDGANLTENCVKLVNIQNYDRRFIYYYLKSASGQNQIHQGIVGSSQPKLPIYNIEKIELPDIDLDTQTRIIRILDSIDTKININNHINENLEQQAQALFKAWFVDFEPFGGVMPGDWRMGTLSEICGYSKDKVDIDDLTLDTYYSTENMQPNRQGAVQATTLPTIKQTTACKKGDVLISNIRPYF